MRPLIIVWDRRQSRPVMAIELLIYPGQTTSHARTTQRELGAEGVYAMAKLVKSPAGVIRAMRAAKFLRWLNGKGRIQIDERCTFSY